MVKQGPLTTGQIAKHCNVTHRAVLKWVTAGKLKAYRTPGMHSRVRLKDFLDFLREYRMPVPEEFAALNKKKKILIVDDDRGIVNSLKRLLRTEKNYEVDFAFDGFDAGRKLIAFRPDLVLLDIRMPGIDGYEVARRIKESPEGARTRIIAISAYFQEERKGMILAIGADACMEKPFDNDDLLRRIKVVLSL